MNTNGLTQQQIAQQDFVDNIIFSLIRVINPSDKQIEWDMEMIGEIRDVLKEWLVAKLNLTTDKIVAKKFNIDTRLIENKTDTQKNNKILGDDLTFISVREFERTKHVHRFIEEVFNFR